MKSVARKSTSNSFRENSLTNNTNHSSSDEIIIDDDEEDCIMIDNGAKEKVSPVRSPANTPTLMAKNNIPLVNGQSGKKVEKAITNGCLKRSLQVDNMAVKKLKKDTSTKGTISLTGNELREMFESKVSDIILKHNLVSQIKLDLEQLRKTREFWKNQAEKMLKEQNTRKIEQLKTLAPKHSAILPCPSSPQKISQQTPNSNTQQITFNINNNIQKLPPYPRIPVAVGNRLPLPNKVLSNRVLSNQTNGPSNGVNKSVIDLTADAHSSLLPPKLPSPSLQLHLPAKPIVKIQTINQGIVLTWTVQGNATDSENAKMYELYSFQNDVPFVPQQLWKKVGNLDALPLPMACTLKSLNNRKYFFAIRAIDKFNRFGPFSDPVSTSTEPT